MRYTLLNFNEFRDACHTASVNAGWWKGSERKNRMFAVMDGVADPDRLTVPTKLCLVHSEISEMYEGYLSGNNDDHLPHLPGALVEGGDVLIRIGDLAGYLEIDLTSAIALVLQADHIGWGNPNYTLRYGGNIYPDVGSYFALAHVFTSGAMEGYRKNAPDAIIPALSAIAANLARVVILIDMIATKNNWDLPAAAEAKMAYNAVRLDHKAEVRALADGKQF